VSCDERSDVVVDAFDMVLFQARDAIMRKLCISLNPEKCEMISLTSEKVDLLARSGVRSSIMSPPVV
jgi:hypothetical protein